MNARDTLASLFNQCMAAYDAKCAECDAKDRTIAELRTELDMANREIAFHRGELDEPLSLEPHPSHIMLPERDEYEEGPNGPIRVTRTSCERCGFETWHTDKSAYWDDELGEPCQGHRVMDA